MATQQEVIKAFMKSLDLTTLYGKAILDEAIKACSPFNSMQYVINKMVADCKNAKSADNFLKTYCGINLDNEDTGAITGLDAGGSTIKTAESIVPESGKLKNFKKNSFTVNGLTIKLGGGRKFSDLNDSEKFIWQGLYTWWAKGALDLIAESYGDNFSFTNKSSATVKKLEFNFYTSEDGHAGAETGAHYSFNKADSLSMKVDLRFFGSAVNNANNSNGKSDISSSYLDRLLAHEFTHAVMFANLDYLTEPSLPSIIYEGMSELTVGNTDKNGMLEMAGNSTLLKKMLDSEADTNSYAGGYMFLRYLARQAGDLTIKNTTSKTTVQSFYGNDSVRNENADSVKIFGGSGNDDLSNSGGNKITLVGGAGNDLLWNQPKDGGADAQRVSMNGGEGDDSITNFGNHATLVGGTGNDTVNNYKYGFRNGELIFGDVGKNVKIYGGKGEDVINNSGANVKIDSGDGKDTVENYNGAWASINTGNGNDSIRNINASDADSHYVTIESGAGDDTIHNHQGNFALINGGKGNDSIYDGSWYSTLFGGAGKDSITTDGDSVTVDAGAGNDYIINHGKSVSLFGGNGDDIIRNYVDNVTVDGGKGADTLIGGKSNDNLRGGSGNDSLIGGNGKDTLSGGTGDDKLLGGAGNDSINGGAGKDSLWGGKGNDTLFGGDGADKFIYSKGDGKDVILGFDNSDTLTFDNLEFTSSYSKKTKSVLLKFDNGSVTFKNFSATTFHINNGTYKISGSKFKIGK